MHVASLMAERLELSDEDRRIVRLCLLLHDVGHGPFSHLFDFVCEEATTEKYDHERVGRAIVEQDPSIRKALGADYDRVAEELAPKRGVLHDLVSGGLDADKLDYLRRDSYFAGVEYGKFDFNRILWTIQKDKEINHVVVDEKGMDSIEGFRLARLLMHVQVYTHHTRLIADRMLCRTAKLCVEIKPELRGLFVYPANLDSAALNRVRSLDDVTLLRTLGEAATGSARDLIDRINSRRLLKRGLGVSLDNVPVDARSDIVAGKFPFDQMEASIAGTVGVDRNLVFVTSPKVDDKQYHGWASQEPVLVKLSDGQIKEYGDISFVRAGTEAAMRKLYVFGPEGFESKIEDAAKTFLRNHH